MKRLLWAALVAALALAGCDPKKSPNAPSPKTTAAQTAQELQAQAAAAPASDPSLPSAATALAEQDAAAATVVR